MAQTRFTKEAVDLLIDVFNNNYILEKQLIEGDISEDEFITENIKLGFNIPDNKKKIVIDGIRCEWEHKDETDNQFKERVVDKLKELGIDVKLYKKQK